MNKHTTLLVGDVGTTATTLALVTGDAGPRAPLLQATYRNNQHPSLEALAQVFLARTNFEVERAVFNVAAPLLDEAPTSSVQPWVADAEHLHTALRLASVAVLTPLEATAYALPVLEPIDLLTLQQGEPVAHGTQALIVPDATLGEAFLTSDGTRYHAHLSAGGYADFAPTNFLEMDMFNYLQDRFRHVSYDQVCSAAGLTNIYGYLKHVGHADEPAWLHAKLVRTNDQAAAIIAAAYLNRSDGTLCHATLERYVSILGAEAANLALKVLARGGVYLAGSLLPQLVPTLTLPWFLEAFRHKAYAAGLLARVPVYLVTNSRITLLGAAAYGLAMD